MNELQRSLLEQVDIAAGNSGSINNTAGSSSGGAKNSALEQLRQRTRYAHAHAKLERMEKEKTKLEATVATLERQIQVPGHISLFKS